MAQLQSHQQTTNTPKFVAATVSIELKNPQDILFRVSLFLLTSALIGKTISGVVHRKDVKYTWTPCEAFMHKDLRANITFGENF